MENRSTQKNMEKCGTGEYMVHVLLLVRTWKTMEKNVAGNDPLRHDSDHCHSPLSMAKTELPWPCKERSRAGIVVHGRDRIWVGNPTWKHQHVQN